jgi:hypothetical protein
MPITVADRVLALLDTMTRQSLDTLPPARRRQLAASLQHWAKIAEKRDAPSQPKAGVLADLCNGGRVE